ncbi:hypothetical protein [Shewanella mangrovisoli]|uniref:hypothetical protein n=1 Tax=Shewanella mangrovisoli TaxID=2864211 RepID=UPI000143C8F6
MKLVLQITLGILLASLVTLLVRIGYLSYVEYRVKQEINEIALQQQQREKARQQAVKERQLAEYQKQQFTIQRAAEQRRIAQQNEAARIRKAEAWRKYYIVPEDCKNYKSDEHMVNCLNHKADAKAEFDKAYDTEKLILK